MSKTTLKRIGAPILVILAPFAAIALLFVVAGLIFFGIPSIQSKHRQSEEYSKIVLPSYLRLTAKQWTGGGVDNAAEWNYSYASSQPIGTTYADLITATRKAGYAITEARLPSGGAQIRSGLRSLSTVDTSDGPTIISATKKNMYVHFDLDEGKVDAMTYESHNPRGK